MREKIARVFKQSRAGVKVTSNGVANFIEYPMSEEECVSQVVRDLSEEIEKGLLTDEEKDNCTPSDKQLEDFLAEPDDEVAAKLRTEDPITFRVIGRCLLYGRNIAQAQLQKILTLLKE